MSAKSIHGMASTPRTQTFAGRRVQLDRAPLARPRVPERPGSPRCRSGSSRPGRCNVFDSGAAHECRLEDAEAYDFFETFPKVSAERRASIAIESNVCLDWNRLTLSLSLSLSLSRSLARLTHNAQHRARLQTKSRKPKRRPRPEPSTRASPCRIRCRRRSPGRRGTCRTAVWACVLLCAGRSWPTTGRPR